MRKRLVVLSSALLFATAAACSGATNPLLGKWKLTSDPTVFGSTGCYTALTFTATKQTLDMKGDAVTTNITYNVSPGIVYAIGNTGAYGATGYKITGKDTIAVDSWGTCVYARVK